MSLSLYLDGVIVASDEIKWDIPADASVGASGTFTFDWTYDEIGPALSAEDYAIIEDVIIDSIVRGYMQDRRDVIDPA